MIGWLHVDQFPWLVEVLHQPNHSDRTSLGPRLRFWPDKPILSFLHKVKGSGQVKGSLKALLPEIFPSRRLWSYCSLSQRLLQTQAWVSLGQSPAPSCRNITKIFGCSTPGCLGQRGQPRTCARTRTSAVGPCALLRFSEKAAQTLTSWFVLWVETTWTPSSSMKQKQHCSLADVFCHFPD